MTEIITFSVSRKLREKVDNLRGDVARSKFIRRALENAINSYNMRKIPSTQTGPSSQGLAQSTQVASNNGGDSVAG